MTPRPRHLLAAAAACCALAGPAHAALAVGDAAPPVNARAALAGEPFTFELGAALDRGPVVLYFFPKAFTQGCTIEANAFAEAMPQFSALGASVVGISRDDIDTLSEFSVRECRDRFPVASDASGQTVEAYDAQSVRPGVAGRISYVIDPSGRIAFVHEGSDPLAHVSQALRAVEELGQAER